MRNKSGKKRPSWQSLYSKKWRKGKDYFRPWPTFTSKLVLREAKRKRKKRDTEKEMGGDHASRA